MSLDADSPTHSSSSDDFAAFLAGDLDSASDRSVDVPSEDEEEDEDEDDDMNTERIKRQKVEVSVSITEMQGSTYNRNEGQTSNDVSVVNDKCDHPLIMKRLCTVCGQTVDEESVASMMNGSAVPFSYILEGTVAAKSYSDRLRDTDLKDLLRRRKLILVLDLDHTLLNSTRLQDLKPDEEYLLHKVDSLQDVSKGQLFRLDFMRMMTKLRPFVRKFLEEASDKFDLYIYTMGERAYANEMAKLLDPRNVYFPSRVIAKDDCTKNHQKGLDVVLGQESAILILDDTEFVWRNHRENLILMERYHYFASSCQQFGFNSESLSQSKNDENEANGTLAVILEVLKKIHGRFFDLEHGPLLERDVRKELKSVRKGVLEGCKIVFSRVFPNQSTENPKMARDLAENHPLWKMAQELGAICVTDTDPSVTHVIARDKTTVKAHWVAEQNKQLGEEQKKFLVNPSWLEASNFFWKRQPENEFQVL